MPRNQKLIIIAFACTILVLITWQITVKSRTPAKPEISIPAKTIPESVEARGGLSVRQYALEAFGSSWFRPCTIHWTPPNTDHHKESNQPDQYGSVQAYVVYVDGVQRARVEKEVTHWLIDVEGDEVSVRSANSKAESSEVRIFIPIDCLPLPKLPLKD